MNDQHLENKVRADAANIEKDFSSVVKDGVFRFGKYEDNVSQATVKAKRDLTTWAEDGVTQMSKGFEKLADDAKESVVGAVATVKKEVGHGLSQYNAKAQAVADRVSGGFSKKAARYPWVLISSALVVGFVLGSLLKPARRSRR